MGERDRQEYGEVLIPPAGNRVPLRSCIFTYLKPMIRKIWALLLLPVLACEEVLFNDPQPKGSKPLTEIPSKIRGKYMIGPDQETIETDTVRIDAREFRIGSEGSDIHRLGDSIRFTGYKGWYFVNFREKSMWDVKALKLTPDRNLEYYSIDLSGDDQKKDSLLRAINALVPIQHIPYNGDTLLVIDPTPKQLLTMVRKGYYRKVIMKRVK